MTIKEIHAGLQHLKPCGLRQVRRYLNACRILPLGWQRQSPQQYPPDSLGRILKSLGFYEEARATEKLVSLRTLQRERARAKAGQRQKARAA